MHYQQCEIIDVETECRDIRTVVIILLQKARQRALNDREPLQRWLQGTQ